MTDPQSSENERAPKQESSPKPKERGALTRRGLLTGGVVVGAGVIAAGIAGQLGIRAHSAATAETAEKDAALAMNRYRSTKLTIPTISTWKNGRTADGLLFVNPKVDGFRGLIMDETGEPVWIEPTGENLTDIRVQRFEGKDVLTYWTGKSTGGHGQGTGMIFDTSYRKLFEVNAGNGLDADLHEFNLTDRGTALLTAYKEEPYDLSAIGGPKDGYLYNCYAQEVDIRTGKVLLHWNVLDHVDVTETYTPIHDNTTGHDGSSVDKAFDAFHINAIDDDGDVLYISMRHTHTVYKIDRDSGEVFWRLGGKKSNFTIPEKARFAWQHDVRKHPDGTLSIFDNHLIHAKEGGRSSGKYFRLDEANWSAELTAEYEYSDHLGTAMGSNQLLPNGNVLVGWGTDPFLTEFTAGGEAIWEARDVGEMAYRVNRAPWTATPTTRPDVAAERRAGGVDVYASWNGATEVARWRILAGAEAGSAKAIATVPRDGFETRARIRSGRHVSVQALDTHGKVLASSKEIRVS